LAQEGAHAIRGHHVRAAAEQGLDILLKPDQIEQGRTRVEIHQEVDIGIRPVLTVEPTRFKVSRRVLGARRKKRAP
jgi:hypothetical protein